MRKTYFIMLVLLAVAMVKPAVAQDTISVQTFTFDSITTRRGVWNFPDDDQTYRKVLMYYTLKCDAATTHDRYNCGEWDYLTYSKIWEHTGVYDSTLYYHPSFTKINGASLDSVELTTEQTKKWYRRQHVTTSFPDTSSYQNWTSGDDTEPSDRFLETSKTNGRRQVLYTQDQLLGMGMMAGNINGMKLFVENGTGVINNLLIRAIPSSLDVVTPYVLTPVQDTLFYNTLNIAQNGWVDIPFSMPLLWDGDSGILFDIAFENQEPMDDISIAVHPDDASHTIITDDPNYFVDFDGAGDFISVDPSNFIHDNFTIEYWVYKKSNNNWSRVFDFANGPGQNNILMSLTTGGNGNQTIAIYNEEENKSLELGQQLPLKEWTHVAVKMWNDRIVAVYYNGEVVHYGTLHIPDDIIRTINYIARSNWSSDQYANMLFDDFRLYNISLDEETILQHMHTTMVDPANEEGLVLYYDFTPGANDQVTDLSPMNVNGTLLGKPALHTQCGGVQFTGFIPQSYHPMVMFYSLESSSIDNEEEWVLYEKDNAASQFVLFEDPENPTQPTDTIAYYEAGYQYVFNVDGSKYDSVFYETELTLMNEEMPYYGEPFEIVDQWELARFITPYGINLDLGPDGFTWVYDVTDYVDMLKGEVDLSAGNQQELLDVRFDFITGIPPRDVLEITRPWGQFKSRKYSALDENTCLAAKDIALLPETKEAIIKTRLTGHGHNSNTGDYPHCCEWKDNTHYLLSDGDTIADWHIWQATECPENPVYPQGGTWPGEREGWCPGDMVDDIEWELTPYIQDNIVNIDYDITDVPEDNIGMGNGNYVVAMHIVQYGETHLVNDAEVFDVISPNNDRYYSRLNPICADPQVVIRNNGSAPLTSLQVHYGVKGGESNTWHWTGIIDPHKKAKISLPVWGDSFWFGDDSNTFEVSISMPNGVADEYADNNYFSTQYTMPDIYDEKIVVKLKMNYQAERYSIGITNIFGETVYQRLEMANDSIYVDTLNFPMGCYSLRLLDEGNMGLSYWAYPEQGSGYLKFLNEDGLTIKQFQSEFGRSINYSFVMGEMTYIKESGMDAVLDVFPVPASNVLHVTLDKIDGEFPLKIYRQDGTLVYEETIISVDKSRHTIDVSGFPAGIYMLTGKTTYFDLSRKIIIQ